jgi:hypothetical protein
LKVLEDLVDDADHLSVYLGVQSIFDVDRRRAFDRLAPYFEEARLRERGGAIVAEQTLQTFAPSSFASQGEGGIKPEWTEAWAQEWIEHDRRWLDLCVRLRLHEKLGQVARNVLRYASASTLEAALADARSREAPRVVVPYTVAARDLVSRYRAGEHEQVWQELRAHEAIDGEFRAEALEVACETMQRVAACADTVASRLSSRGWRALSGALRAAPTGEDVEAMQRFTAFLNAPLPSSLHAFWALVGGIDFVWNYDAEEAMPDLGIDLGVEDLDPLCVHSASMVASLLEEWEERRSPVDPELSDPFNVELAPDSLHKANTSGGPPYRIELPFTGADPVFMDEVHNAPFVDYLRLAFRWGGFPGLAQHAERPGVRTFVAEMTKGLEPF